MEIWKYIDNNKLYMVSSLGQVKSTGNSYTFYNFNGTEIKRPNHKNFLKSRDNGHGYLTVVLGRKKRFYVHRLVATLFTNGKNSIRKYVNHKNGVKFDNRAENLEWVTASENQLHSKNTGLCKLGESHPQSKLSNDTIKFIKEHYKPFDLIFGAKPLSKKFNVSKATISKIANNHARKHG